MQESFPRNPLRIYQFRVGLLDAPDGGAPGAYVAGVQKVSGLGVSLEASETWSGGNRLHRYANPRRAIWESITLEQGLALGDTLERWAQAALDFVQTGRPTPGEPVKRNLFIDLWDPSLCTRGEGAPAEGDRLRRYLVNNAWVSRFRALPQLDGMSDQVALLSVEIVHEGWRLTGPGELPGGFARNS